MKHTGKLDERLHIKYKRGFFLQTLSITNACSLDISRHGIAEPHIFFESLGNYDSIEEM